MSYVSEWWPDYVPPMSESQSEGYSGVSDKALTTLLPQEPAIRRPAHRSDKPRWVVGGGTISTDIPHSTTASSSPGKPSKPKTTPTVNHAATQVTQSLYQDKVREAGVQAHLSQEEQCAAASESTQEMLTVSYFDVTRTIWSAWIIRGSFLYRESFRVK